MLISYYSQIKFPLFPSRSKFKFFLENFQHFNVSLYLISTNIWKLRTSALFKKKKKKLFLFIFYNCNISINNKSYVFIWKIIFKRIPGPSSPANLLKRSFYPHPDYFSNIRILDRIQRNEFYSREPHSTHSNVSSSRTASDNNRRQ